MIKNNIVAVFSQNRVTLHNIDSEVGGRKGANYFEKKFPLNDKDKGVIHGTLSEHFLVFIDQGQKIKYFNVHDQEMSLEYQSEYKLS